MLHQKKKVVMKSFVPVTWARIIFDGAPFSSIPESEVEDFKRWYPRGISPSRTEGKQFYRTGIAVVTHNKRQNVIAVVFEKDVVPDLTSIDVDDIDEAKAAVQSLSSLLGHLELSDAAKYHAGVNSSNV